jgi:glycosyltransferase involved in cell wall biosynthesis
LPDHDLEAAYVSATALLALSGREGFGLPAVEAAIRGVPVVAADIPAAREALVGAATFVPDDPESIAAAMTDVKDPGDEVRLALRRRYDPATIAPLLVASYERLVG